MSASVFAFYGFKGGTGRSFVMAHIAALLASHGKKVLLIDADLEAPGLGDFYDAPGRAAFQGWRGTRGLMDALRDLANDTRRNRSLVGEKLKRHVEETLSGAIKDNLIQLTFQNEGRDQHGPNLMGPGNHIADPKLGGQAYVSNFLNFDWNAFLRRGGTELLATVGEYWREGSHGFDYVLIDTRTGYNLPSILVLQHWATHIVGVGTWSFQSIDGLARMLPVACAGLGQGRDVMPAAIVMNKTPPPGSLKPGPQQVYDVKEKLVEKYFVQAPGPKFEQFSIEFCTPLQRNDRMVFSELDWDSYESIRRAADEKNGGHSSRVKDGSLYKFLVSVGNLLEWLTDETLGLPDDKILKRVFEDFQPLERGQRADPEKQQPEDQGSLSQVQREAGGSSFHELAIIESFVSLAKRHIEPQKNDARHSDQSRDHKQKDLFALAEDEFARLGKEGRALARHRLLTEVLDDSNLSDRLANRFAVGIDPTTAFLPTREQLSVLDNSPELARKDPPNHYTAIRLTLTEPNAEEWEDVIDQYSRVDASLAVVLRVFREITLTEEPGQADTELVRCEALAGQMCELIAEDGPAVPKGWQAFGKWNIFDLLDGLAARLSIVLQANGRADLGGAGGEVAALCSFLLERLSNPIDWAKWHTSADFDDRIRCLFQWHGYLLKVCSLLELSDRSWRGLDGRTAQRIRDAMNLPAPGKANEWKWVFPDRVTEEDLGSLSQLTISLDLLSITELSAQSAMPLAETLIERVLRHKMIALHGDPKSAQPELRWADCLLALNETRNSLGDVYLTYRLTRRISRILRHVPKSHQTRHAASIALSSLDTMNFPTDLALWAEHHYAVDNEKKIGLREILEASFKIKKGYFRQGRELFDGFDDAPDTSEPLPRWWQRVDSLLKFRAFAYAELGSLDIAERIHNRYLSLAEFGSSLSRRGEHRNRRLNTLRLVHSALLADRMDVFDRLLDAVPIEDDVLTPADLSLRALLGCLRHGNEIDLESTLASALSRTIPLLAYGPDEGASRWAGVNWNGCSLLLSGKAAFPMTFGVEGLHAVAVEAATISGHEGIARRVLERWSSYTEMSSLLENEMTPLHHTQRSWLAAFNFLYGEKGAREMALRHRDADIENNGEERAFAYRRVFELCAIKH